MKDDLKRPITIRHFIIQLMHNMQGSAEIPDDWATQLLVESFAWGICLWAPFWRDSKHLNCHGALVCRASEFHCAEVFLKQWVWRRDSADISPPALQYCGTSVPSRNTVLLWVRNFRQTASAAKRKPPGRETSLRTSNDCVRLLSEVPRLRECADNKGRHLTDTIFRKWIL